MTREKIWFRKLGYKDNPFTIKPGFFDDQVLGYDEEVDSVIEKIKNGDMMYLEGEFGQGKTTILEYVINEFSSKHKIAHIHRSRKDRALNYERLLKGAGNALKKAFNVKQKNVILIVDEANYLNRKDCDRIEQYYEQGYFKAVLFQDHSFKEAPMTDSLKKKIGDNIVSLKKLTQDDAITLVRSRLDDGKELVSDTIIKNVFKKSFKNTRHFLENMEDVCRHAVENGRTSVSEEDLNILE